MNPDDVFDKFNEIIGPEFSLVTGKRLKTSRIVSGDETATRALSKDEIVTCTLGSEDDRISNVRHEQQQAYTIVGTDPPSNSEDISNENDERNVGFDEHLSDPKIARNLHWRLFEPNELVYIKRKSGPWTKVFEEECALVTDITETATNDDDDGHDKSTHVLRYIRAGHNGHQFGVTSHTLKIGSSSEEIVNITAEDLGVIPMRLLPTPERQSIEATLMSRGEKYYRICEGSHEFMQYEGPITPLDLETDWTWTTNQRVIFDGRTGWKMNDTVTNDISVASHRGKGLKAFLSSESHSNPDEYSSLDNDELPEAKGKQKSSEYEKTRGDHEWTNIDFLTCPSTLVAFSLDEKVWVNVQVERLSDVVWLESPFDFLELDTGKKKLIQNLTRRFKTKGISEEVVAEEAQRPLYRVSTRELSFDPSSLKKQLSDHFILGRRWGAIMLIDEADMFMPKGQSLTPAQNATVTAFVRLLRTYDGLLFLISTSEDIDDVVYDQIHATIKYVNPDESQRTNIWRDAVYTPDQDAYQTRNASYWAQSAQLKPWAIVQPRNAEEVSKTVQALVATPACNFAVRSGGHTVWPGASNIQDGITIDLGLMAKTTYNHETKLASLLPGGRWTDVYHEVEKHGRMVAGGRENAVGIGGLTTGGGKTFYTCRVGFACDQVVNYEVVLADGSIVQANDQEHSDLFRVLKGGGNNFGIVTRFDMVTFPSKDIWDVELVHAKESAPEVVEALSDFTGNLEAHPDSHVLAMWMYLPKADDHFIENLLMSLDGEQEARSLSKFLAIPGQVKSKTTTVATKMDTFALPKAREHTWFTTTFKNDPRISQKAADVFESLVKVMKSKVPDHDFAFQMVLQPLPVSFGKHSAVRGGNMFGLEHIKDDCVLLVWTVEVATPELRTTVAFPALKGAIDEIEAYAKSVNGNVKFRYLNYCDASQDPLSSYGEENVRKMREAAEKYDPAGVFQRRVPGGFKISKANVA
ncbi:Bifunctional solanapyrone synthase [Colletotrichum sp. SAR 10_75]|nr:Bifunctional solanapyrone synthase [Colletotrichum sp. SAR 10_75]